MKTLLNLVGLTLTIMTMSTCQPVQDTISQTDNPSGQAEYFTLQRDVSPSDTGTQAVLIGNTIKIFGTVNVDKQSPFLSRDNMKNQLDAIYRDLEKTLHHFGCTFDDVVLENIYTTDMETFLQHANNRTRYYKSKSPAGSWMEVKKLTQPESVIEIELEAERN